MSQEICPKCLGSGWEKIERDGRSGVARCDCIKGSRSERLLKSANIPQRYEHCELEEFATRNNPSLEIAKTIAEGFVDEFPMSPPFGLLYMGPQGIGKSTVVRILASDAWFTDQIADLGSKDASVVSHK